MTQKTKLEIIGPYTPEHPGPFCNRKKAPIEIAVKVDRNGKILGYEGDSKDLTKWESNGQFDSTRMSDTEYDIMNAREVPVAREFWVNEFRNGGWGGMFETEEEAAEWKGSFNFIRTIHVREVLPGEGA
ncbi:MULTISPECIES: hypothetical protein [Acetobacter]|uniref:Uncharacterized protein n=1 Tax=Acetobacter lovaniensis TaxID=104100 RepID=A0A841QGQ2_9PROT|nr:hypothetical protein [Acetobacter lovaniensis]MBB6457217.1 hypothetical protein [Acetobacter lovaniensis]NHN81204.1 hypothetical protein [Acetobacter lovaniensis]GBQ69358.1 hypothetical protein AA0474_1901 [Acetobacter lovaniensis NRIC 0474]